MKLDYPASLQGLILQLKRLPGIGSRSAERMALWILQQPGETPLALAESLVAVHRDISSCSLCGFFTTPEGCAVCAAPDRDPALLCIVEQPTDILPIERTGIFRGHYHALGGRLSPLDNIGPEDLRVAELLDRVRDGGYLEIVLATGADVAGEATSHYLAQRLAALALTPALRLTRLAQGMPVGGGLDTADSLTLHRAFQHRRPLESAQPHPA